MSGELDTRGIGDGSLRHGRVKRLARGSWGLAVLKVETKVTAKLHGRLRGLHQDITLAGECCFLVVLAGRKRDRRHYHHGLPERTSLLDERSGVAVHLHVDLETDLGAHRRYQNTSHSGGMGEGPRDNAACACMHDLSVAVAGERAGGHAGEERLCSSSWCHASREKLQCKGLYLGMVGEVVGSASRPREVRRLERRGAQGAEAAAHAVLPLFPFLFSLLLPLWVLPLPRNDSSLFRTANVAERPSGAGIAITGQNHVLASLDSTCHVPPCTPDGLRTSSYQHCTLLHQERRSPTHPDGSSQTLQSGRFPDQLPLPSHRTLRLGIVARTRPSLCSRSHLQSGKFLLPRDLACSCPCCQSWTLDDTTSDDGASLPHVLSTGSWMLPESFEDPELLLVLPPRIRTRNCRCD